VADWKDKNKVLNYAGRTETDMWEQLVPHLDYVEQIYFAGGEPLLMEEHYHILEELVRSRFDVRLIYNTNFTHTQSQRTFSVFEYWKQFDSVSNRGQLRWTVDHVENTYAKAQTGNSSRKQSLEK
jgi:organic radical activating enzyme